MLEPVAWMYSHPDGLIPPSVRRERHFNIDRNALLARGWTETPLYALPEPAADLVEVVAAAIRENDCWRNWKGDAVFKHMARAVLTAISPHIAAREQAAHNAAIEAAAERFADRFSDAVQADTENGVRWLNERASKKYLKDAPATLAAIMGGEEAILALKEPRP